MDLVFLSLASLYWSVNGHQYQPAAQFTGQPVGHQQQPGYGQPGHGYQQPNQNLLHDSNRIHDREHIKEHLHGVLGEPDLSKMTEEELQFHYFKMHDNDNNNKLDGSELIKSLIHWHGKLLYDTSIPIYVSSCFQLKRASTWARTHLQLVQPRFLQIKN